MPPASSFVGGKVSEMWSDVACSVDVFLSVYGCKNGQNDAIFGIFGLFSDGNSENG